VGQRIVHPLGLDHLVGVDELRAHGIGFTRATNPRAYEMREKYSTVYMHYKPEKEYWVVNVILRKALIAFSALMFRGNATFQLATILLVLFWAFVMQVLNRPFLR